MQTELISKITSEKKDQALVPKWRLKGFAVLLFVCNIIVLKIELVKPLHELWNVSFERISTHCKFPGTLEWGDAKDDIPIFSVQTWKVTYNF